MVESAARGTLPSGGQALDPLGEDPFKSSEPIRAGPLNTIPLISIPVAFDQFDSGGVGFHHQLGWIEDVADIQPFGGIGAATVVDVDLAAFSLPLDQRFFHGVECGDELFLEFGGFFASEAHAEKTESVPGDLIHGLCLL